MYACGCAWTGVAAVEGEGRARSMRAATWFVSLGLQGKGKVGQIYSRERCAGRSPSRLGGWRVRAHLSWLRRSCRSVRGPASVGDCLDVRLAQLRRRTMAFDARSGRDAMGAGWSVGRKLFSRWPRIPSILVLAFRSVRESSLLPERSRYDGRQPEIT